MRKTTLRLLMTVIAVIGFAFYGNAQYLTEDFESGAIPTGWTNEHVSSTVDWDYQDGDDNALSAHGGSFNAIFASSSYDGDATKLVTSEIDLSGATSPQINFWHAQKSWSGDQDILRLYYKTSAAGTWTLLQEWTSELTSWNEETITLPNPTATYYLAFEGTSDWGYGVVVDDIIVQEAPTCPAAISLTASDITLVGATLSFTSGGSESAWNLEWGPTGFTQGTGTTLNLTDTFTVLAGLTAGTDYDFYVQADCGTGDQSIWNGAYTFSTVTYGDDCANAIAVTLPADFTANVYADLSQTTYGRSNSSDTTCLVSYDGGEDIFYEFTVTEDMWVNITMDPKSTTYTGIALTSDCPSSSNCIEVISNSGTSLREMNNVFLAVGTYHIMIDTWPAPEYIDDFDLTIDRITCPMPIALNVQDLTGTSANLAWTTGGSTTWNVMFDRAGFDTTGLGPLSVDITTNPLLVDTLTEETDYEFYVRDACSATDTSEWVGPFAFTTTASCPNPTDLDATDITSSSANLAWNGYFATHWDILFGEAGFDTTGVAITANDITDNPLSVDTLQAATSYDFYVRADCGQDNVDTSVWVGPFSFTTEVSCPAPMSLEVSGLTASSATLSWVTGGASNFNLVYGIQGFTMTDSTAIVVADTFYVATGLASGTNFEFYVQDSCGMGDVSTWTGPYSFTTECDVVSSFPWLEDFEENGTNLPICFNNVEGTWNMGSESYSGNYAARITYSHSQPANLESPDFMLPANFQISFMWKDDDISTAKVAGHDTTFFEISTDDGSSWISLDTLSAPSSESSYSMAEHDLSAYAGTFKFRFRDVTDAAGSAYGTGIDSIVIREKIITDIALVTPGNEDVYDCSFTGQDTVPFFVQNVGNTIIAENDTIFAWYELDGGTAVADTFIVATDLNPTDTMFVFFEQEADLAGLTTHNYKVYFNYEPGTDMNQVNDTTIGTVTHYALTVDLGGVNDTIQTASYPYTLDAGVNYDSYLWNDASMLQTLEVSADGWYTVIVTDTNDCDATDSVYVQLVTGINSIEGISLNVYPNPNNGEFTINANFNSVIDFTVEIINLNGKTIYTKEFNGVDAVNETIDIDEYSKGVYYIRIVNNDFVKQEKVIVY